jgi:hypothetical protein
MAAPLELRTPNGTAARAASECGWKHGDNGAGDWWQRRMAKGMMSGKGCSLGVIDQAGHMKMGDSAIGKIPKREPRSCVCSELTSGKQGDRVPGSAARRVDERDARTVLAGKGALRRAKNRRALACCAPFWRSTDATGGSGGNTISATAGLCKPWGTLPQSAAPQFKNRMFRRIGQGAPNPQRALNGLRQQGGNSQRKCLTATGLLMEAASVSEREFFTDP